MKPVQPPMMRTSLKIIVLGDKCVGKTTLINALLDEDGTETSRYFTMGLVSNDVVHYELDTEEYGNVMLNIWDTVGEEYNHVISNSIFRRANGIIVVYDVTNRDSFAHVTAKWLPRIHELMGDGGLGDDTDVDDIMSRDNIFKILFVANKIDVVGDKRRVTNYEARSLTDAYQLPFIQLSTISDEHDTIKLPFILLTSLLMPFFAMPRRGTSRLNLHDETRYTNDSTTCC